MRKNSNNNNNKMNVAVSFPNTVAQGLMTNLTPFSPLTANCNPSFENSWKRYHYQIQCKCKYEDYHLPFIAIEV